MCEDFAPRNEDIRLSGERGANRPARSPAKLHFSAGSCVKILLPETKRQGLAGGGEQTGLDPGPAYPKFPARGSRKETENKGLAGSRARTMSAVGPAYPKFPARGSRKETEKKGLAGSRARTMPAAGPPTPKHPARGSHAFSSVKLLLQLTPKIILKKIKKVLDKRVLLLYNKSCVEQRK